MALATFLVTISDACGFYLPGVAPRDSRAGEENEIQVCLRGGFGVPRPLRVRDFPAAPLSRTGYSDYYFVEKLEEVDNVIPTMLYFVTTGVASYCVFVALGTLSFVA